MAYGFANLCRFGWPAILLLLALVCRLGAATAEDLLPPETPTEQVVDHYIDLRLKAQSITPAAAADDATFIRRVTLDLVGRIPTALETTDYVQSTDPEKRVRLVDRLLASPGFARHQATELEAMLMAGNPGGNLRDYLKVATTDNKSWDQIFRDLLLARQDDEKLKGAAEFLKPRLADIDKLTNDVSTTFFGVNVSCAKCHDHPLVPDWTQEHFFGMKSFFNRTFDNGGFLAERDYGVVKYKSTKGEEREARFMFLSGQVIEAPAKNPTDDEKKQENQQLEEFKKQKVAPPAPSYSIRAQLVELALRPGEQTYFARSIANRLWQRMFGFGLVMPIDQMHSENPPSHPELLSWLARDVASHDYDLRRIIRGLSLSHSYSRSSRWDAGDQPRKDLFAVALVRPLTPMQLASSLEFASASPAQFPTGISPEEFEKKVESIENRGRGFANQIEQPTDDFQISVGEALLFSNGAHVANQYLGDGGDRLVGRLKEVPDPAELVKIAVLNAYGRPPTDEELPVLMEYLKQREQRPVDARRELVWALFTGAEFRFNH